MAQDTLAAQAIALFGQGIGECIIMFPIAYLIARSLGRRPYSAGRAISIFFIASATQALIIGSLLASVNAALPDDNARQVFFLFCPLVVCILAICIFGRSKPPVIEEATLPP